MRAPIIPMTDLFLSSYPRNCDDSSNDDPTPNRWLGGTPATASPVEGESGRNDAASISAPAQLAESSMLEGISALRCPAFSTKSLRVGKATFTKPRWCH